MKRHEGADAEQIGRTLACFESAFEVLPGLQPDGYRGCFIKQLIDSIRRVRYVERLAYANIASSREDATTSAFDPLRAAVLAHRRGDMSEAIWLTFLAVHFGKHARHGWALARSVYGGRGAGAMWNWNKTSNDVDGFKEWLHANKTELSKFGFSNHRRREHLGAYEGGGTGAVVDSFVNFIKAGGSFKEIIRRTQEEFGQQPEVVFDKIYSRMNSVVRFGRLGKFDFLTMIAKLGIAPIVPGSAYIWDGATGPFLGAKLLFEGSSSIRVARRSLDEKIVKLDGFLQVGMQPLEDAMCNWQKKPAQYVYFRG